MSAVGKHLTSKFYVKKAISNRVDEPTVVRNIRDNDFNNFNLTNINSITSNTQAVNDNHYSTKSYVDKFHKENEKSRRDFGIDFCFESNDFVKNNQNKVSMIIN